MENLQLKNQKEVEGEMGELVSDSDVSLSSNVTTGSQTARGRTTRSRAAKRPRRKSKSVSSTDNETGSRGIAGPNEDFLAPRQKYLALPGPEEEIEEIARTARENRAALGLPAMDPGDLRTSVALNKQVVDDVNVILSVAAKSKNLKGTFQRALKDSAASIKGAVEIMTSRSTTEEIAKVEAENARLRRELEELRKEIAGFREELARSKQKVVSVPTTTEISSQQVGAHPEYRVLAQEITRNIMSQVGTMFDARFQAMEERLPPARPIRPPLAADRRSASAVVASVASGTMPQPKPGTSTAKKGRSMTRPNEATRIATSNQVTQVPPSSNDEWTTVVRRKGKNTIMRQDGSGRQKSRPARIKLRPPRSAAVVITLQQGVGEEMTYSKVLTKARESINLSGLGIPALRYRQAATGARILEVPGAESSEKADILAAKLKEFLPEGVARVTRPIKCAEMRVIGLDDSVNQKDVITAVAQQGECSEDSIKVGTIHRSAKGTGTIWIRCPVTAAKKLTKEGRLLVGWVSAQIKLLEARPMRCFKCLQKGHVRAQCDSDVDRSNDCYRCCQNGHKARECSAVPKCSLCTEANKPADHILGSKKCSPPKVKSGIKATCGTVPLQPQPEEEMMTG